MNLFTILFLGHTFSRVIERWLGNLHRAGYLARGAKYRRTNSNQIFYLIDFLAPLCILFFSTAADTPDVKGLVFLIFGFFIRWFSIIRSPVPWVPGDIGGLPLVLSPKHKLLGILGRSVEFTGFLLVFNSPPWLFIFVVFHAALGALAHTNVKQLFFNKGRGIALFGLIK